MTTKSQGSKYQSGRTAVEISKLIRADLKAAQKSGEIPASCTFSVRTRGSSLHSAIDVRVTSYPGQITARAFVEHEVRTGGRSFYEGDRLTAEAVALLDKVRAIAAEYQRAEVDSQSDYHNTNYFLSVEFDWQLARDDRQILVDYFEALVQAERAAEDAGPVLVQVAPLQVQPMPEGGVDLSGLGYRIPAPPRELGLPDVGQVHSVTTEVADMVNAPAAYADDVQCACGAQAEFHHAGKNLCGNCYEATYDDSAANVFDGWIQ